jgi:uncharacterized coiled-coil DUF342 family protein
MKAEDKINLLEDNTRVCFAEISEQIQRYTKEVKELGKKADLVHDKLVELETKLDIEILEIQRFKADLLPIIKDLSEEKNE